MLFSARNTVRGETARPSGSCKPWRMSGNSRNAIIELGCAAIGGATGAILRYRTVDLQDDPSRQLVATLLVAAGAFTILGVLHTRTRWSTPVRGFTFALCGTLASASAYTVSGIQQLPWTAAAFLVLTPLAGISGFALGLGCGRFHVGQQLSARRRP